VERLSEFRDSIDWGLLFILILIIACGIFTMYSATAITHDQTFIKQIIWTAASLAVMVFIMIFVDYKWLARFAWPFYGIVTVLLALVFVIGKEVMGAKRWIPLGFFNMQPSELAKIMVIIWISYWGCKKDASIDYDFRDIAVPGLVLFVPILMIMFEPDLGTASITGLVCIGMFLLLGIRRSTLIKAGAVFFGLLPVLWFALKEYQRNRILTFLDPEKDPLGSGYHAIQSKIAVGSGGLYGKGFLKGTQTQLKFLPEHHTDFIFSVIAEEWGFAGCALIIILYFLLVMKIVSIGLKTKDRFGAMLCFGIALFISLHVFINIAMTMGMFPVVGVPLPFISYGGSFMLINLCCIGIVLSISWRKSMF
jgi:rod shape determining protein RodA